MCRRTWVGTPIYNDGFCSIPHRAVPDAPGLVGALQHLPMRCHRRSCRFPTGSAMPIYAYKCASCGHAKDVLQKISDDPLTVCPSCGAASFQKQVTAAGFQLKGSGWYVTDFRGGSGGTTAPAVAGGDNASNAKDAGAGSAGESGAAPAGGGTTTAPATAAPAPAASAAGTPPSSTT